MTPQTTLAPNAPWPTNAELAAAIARSHEQLAFTLDCRKRAKESNCAKREIKKVKS